MSSLRLALKMSMAGAPKTAAPAKTEFDSIPDPPVVRKRKASFEGKPKSKKPKDNKSSNSSVDTSERTDDDFGEKSTRSNSPVNDGGEASVVSMDDNNTLGGSDDIAEFPENLESTAENNAKMSTDKDLEEADLQVDEELEAEAMEAEDHAVAQPEQKSEEEIEVKRDEQDVPDNEEVADSNVVHSDEKAAAPSPEGEDNEIQEKEAINEEAAADSEGQNDKDRKKKKKRGNSMLRGLGLDPADIDHTENTAATENDEENKRYQSSRSAAAAAKSKLSGKAPPPKAEATEAEVPASTAKAKKSGKSTPAPAIEVVVAPAIEWVQCDGCSKWRSVAPHISSDDLPEQWFCYLNTWSAVYNTCEAGEEPVGEDGNPLTPEAALLPAQLLDTTAVLKSDDVDKSAQKPKSKSRSKKEVAAVEGEALPQDDKKEGVATAVAVKKKEGENTDNRRRSTARHAAKPQQNASSDPTATASSVNWVQCNKCNKWRKTPAHINVDDLPEEWYCSLNTWNPLFAKCSAKQEEDDTSADQANNVAPASTTQNAATPATKEKAAKSKKPQSQNVTFASPSGATPGAPVVMKTNWVRCEQKNCKKWRKVPAHIDVDKLPEKWYCSMNTWNPDTAMCDAPEESDSEAEGGQGGANAIASLISLNSKSANTLSYRRIIFGNDGKVRMCFSDKNKNGFGIFSYIYPQNKVYFGAYDESVEPKRRVMYWWSSAYDESVVMAQINAKTNRKTVSTLFNDQDKDGVAEYEKKALNLNLAMKTDIQPTYLLDSIRRAYGMSPSTNHISLPRQKTKAWKLLCNMSLIRRQRGECTVIRSVFLTSTYPNILLTKLQQLIGSCRFQNPEIDACREFMTHDGLKMALRRLETNGEIEVSYTKDGQLLVLLLMPMSILKATLASKNRRLNHIINKVEMEDKWAKEGYPLKMRKFFANGSTSLTQLPVQENAVPVQPTRRTRRNNANKAPRGDNTSNVEDSEVKEAAEEMETEEVEEQEEAGVEVTEEQKDESNDLPDVDEIISNSLPQDMEEEHHIEEVHTADENDEEEKQEDQPSSQQVESSLVSEDSAAGNEQESAMEVVE